LEQSRIFASNSKSKIPDTAKEHDFVVFSNRPRIFHEYANVGTHIRAFATYSWMVGGSNRPNLRLLEFRFGIAVFLPAIPSMDVVTARNTTCAAKPTY
jgi:hypothetical protein